MMLTHNSTDDMVNAYLDGIMPIYERQDLPGTDGGYTLSGGGIKRTMDSMGFAHSYGDAPAIVDVRKGVRQWFHHGKLHRTSGPAVERDNGQWEVWVGGALVARGEGR